MFLLEEPNSVFFIVKFSIFNAGKYPTKHLCISICYSVPAFQNIQLCLGEKNKNLDLRGQCACKQRASQNLSLNIPRIWCYKQFEISGQHGRKWAMNWFGNLVPISKSTFWLIGLLIHLPSCAELSSFSFDKTDISVPSIGTFSKRNSQLNVVLERSKRYMIVAKSLY